MHLGGLTFDTGNTYWGTTSTTNNWQSTSDWGHYETSTRRDYLLPTTSISKGTSFVTDDGGSDDESDVDPPREPEPNGAEVALFFEPEPTPTVPEDVEGGSDEEEEDPRFRAYSPPAHMHNVELSQDDALEFQMYHTEGVTVQVHFWIWVNWKLADPRTSVPVLIANIRSQLKYTSSYRKAWIAKQKALEKMHVNEEGHDYLCNIPFEQWTQAYDGDLRYGQMTSSLAECMNFVLKGTRYLLITSAVRETYFRLAVLFLKRAARTCDCGRFDALRYPCVHVIVACQNLRLDLMSYVDEVYKIEYMYIVCRHVFPPVPDEHYFQSEQRGIKVKCREAMYGARRTSDCGRFDALRYPCAYVIAACQNLRLNPMSYVDEVYKIEYMYNVWRHVFLPVPDKCKWPSVSLAPFKLLLDRDLRRKPKG
ncbi:hypothetical protein GOBAR_AA38973 [Gossypium barbadense]|uniref:SWIM-type domain-containing protein n=1 Tax=Gossypium barbadense TaxID=3634 RepID=A0A2P5VSC5_GOSBA|nr:hypothetical protein GOBAR_AA38973 [Gossypium barbadense]